MIETFDIAGYARISVDDELDRENVSIENQKAIIEEYVKSRLSPSDDPQFPYYLPVEMPVGLLTFHTKDLAAYAKEEF